MTSDKHRKDKAFVQKFDVEALQFNSELEDKWKRFKQEYELLQTCLKNFPKELSAPILMPIGSKVFVRAQLCNTNEVLIRYGDVFTKQTAYEARAVCERNIERCNGMLENLTREKQLISNNVYARQEIITDSDQLQEIIEPYDEEEHESWKKIHRQKVKEYKQKLKQEEVQNKNCETEGVDQQIEYKFIPFLPYCNSETLSGNSCLNFIEDDSSTDDGDVFLNDDDDSVDSDDDDNDDYEDEDEDEDSKIEIVFSNDVPETTGNLKKKIKKTVSFDNKVQIKEFESRPEEHFIRRSEETKQQNENPEVLVTEIDDIVERVSETCLENKTCNREENARPISRFKANRNKSNNVK